MECKPELYQWLDEQGAGGRRESEGSFTLRHAEAWSKLAGFQFPMPEGWSLKVVQAVSIHGKATLEVSRLSEETVFTVKGPENWTRETVEDTIFSLSPGGSSDVNHLGIAIRYLARAADRPFSVCYSGGEKVLWTGQGFQNLAQEQDGPFELRIGHRTFEGKMTSTGSDVLATLGAYCHLAPHAIYLDGYLVTSSQNDPDFGAAAQAQPMALILGPPEEGLEPFLIAPTNRAPTALLRPYQAYFDTELVPQLEGSGECSTAILISLCSQGRELGEGRSRILWLNHGVVVERTPLPIEGGAMGLGIVLSAVGLPTDISGLAPIRNEDYLARRDLALKSAGRLLKTFHRQLGPEGVTTKPLYYRPFALSGIGIMLGIKILALGAILLSLAGLEAAFLSDNLKSMDRELDTALSTLVGALDDYISKEPTGS